MKRHSCVEQFARGRAFAPWESFQPQKTCHQNQVRGSQWDQAQFEKITEVSGKVWAAGCRNCEEVVPQEIGYPMQHSS